MELRTLLKWTGLQTRHRKHPQARVPSSATPRPVSPAHQVCLHMCMHTCDTHTDTFF